MDNEIGISVGVKQGNSTNWYRAHSLNRRLTGDMCIFALDENRTVVIVTAAKFAGVQAGIRDRENELFPDILDLIPQTTKSSA
jgi:hypothetical protein